MSAELLHERVVTIKSTVPVRRRLIRRWRRERGQLAMQSPAAYEFVRRLEVELDHAFLLGSERRK